MVIARDPLVVEAPGDVRYDRSVDAWIVSRYRDVVAALQSNALQAGSADDAWHKHFREEARALYGSSRLEEWRDVLKPSAAELCNATDVSAAIDVIGQVAQPWGRSVAALATGLSLKNVAAVEPLTRDVFNAAREPFDAGLAERGANATSTLCGLFRGQFASLQVQALVALTQSLPAFLGNAWYAMLANGIVPAELTDGTMDELLRYAGPAKAQLRRTVTDLHFGQARIEAGTRVVVLLASANRDPDAFPFPDRMDFARSGVPLLAFGWGKHACPGAGLIRMAASIATRAFLRRFGNARIVGWKGRPSFALRSLESLTVGADE